MRECHSGDIFVSAFYRQNEESFLEGIVKGLEHFGGTPQKIIFDNARVAVKEGFGYHAKATDKYLSLSDFLNHILKLCHGTVAYVPCQTNIIFIIVNLFMYQFLSYLPWSDYDKLNHHEL